MRLTLEAKEFQELVIEEYFHIAGTGILIPYKGYDLDEVFFMEQTPKKPNGSLRRQTSFPVNYPKQAPRKNSKKT